MYCAAVAYARYVYINDEFDPEMKRVVFHQLHEYWETNNKNKSKFPRSDMYYVISARMLLYRGHYTWKYEKNEKSRAVDWLKRGLKGMGKVKYGACLIKEDLKYQIQEMEETIQQLAIPREQRLAGMWILNRKKDFVDDPSTQRQPPKKQTAPVKKTTKSQTRPYNNLLDLISDEPKPTTNFQIHADDETTTSATPSAKKSTRGRFKVDAEVHTPSVRTKPHDTASVSKTAERPKRNNRGPNYLVPKIAIDLTGSSPETNEAKETSIPGSGSKKHAAASRKPKSTTSTRITRKAASQADEK